jgi:hypothetical protein
VLSGRIRMDEADFLHAKSENFGGVSCLSLDLGFTLTAPSHEMAAHSEQWGGILGHDVQGGESARGDDVKCSKRAAKVLCSGVLDRDVGQAHHRCRCGDELALTAVALDERDLSLRERDREREAGEAGTRADIGNRRGLTNGRQLKRDEGVGQVIVAHPVGLAHGRRREWILGEELGQHPKRREGAIGEREPLNQGGEIWRAHAR